MKLIFIVLPFPVARFSTTGILPLKTVVFIAGKSKAARLSYREGAAAFFSMHAMNEINATSRMTFLIFFIWGFGVWGLEFGVQLTPNAKLQTPNFLKCLLPISSRLIRGLHIFLQPLILFPKHMQDVFFCCITMAFVWKKYQSHRASMSLHCIVQPFTLNWESSRVIIHFTMDHQ